MSYASISTLVRLGLCSTDVWSIWWHSQLDADEAADVFATLIGTLVWAN